MKILSFAAVIHCCIVLLTISSCKNSGDEDVLKNNYGGKLSVVYSRGFPEFSAVARLDVEIEKNGTVTFTGGGASDSFEKEAIAYEGADPVTKVRLAGTLTFHSAKGDVMVDGDNEYVLISISSSIQGQMTVWGWDDELGWIQVLDTPYDYEESYSDGTLQFDLLFASSGDGQDIVKTLPDIQGTFTYGYNLTLVVGLGGGTE